MKKKILAVGMIFIPWVVFLQITQGTAFGKLITFGNGLFSGLNFMFTGAFLFFITVGISTLGLGALLMSFSSERVKAALSKNL